MCMAGVWEYVWIIWLAHISRRSSLMRLRACMLGLVVGGPFRVQLWLCHSWGRLRLGLSLGDRFRFAYLHCMAIRSLDWRENIVFSVKTKLGPRRFQTWDERREDVDFVFRHYSWLRMHSEHILISVHLALHILILCCLKPICMPCSVFLCGNLGTIILCLRLLGGIASSWCYSRAN